MLVFAVPWVEGGLWVLHCKKIQLSSKFMWKVLQVGRQPSVYRITAESLSLYKKCCNPCRKHAQWKCRALAHLLNDLPVVPPTIKPFTVCVCKRYFNDHENLKVWSISDHKTCTESIFHCPTAHHWADNVAVRWFMMPPVYTEFSPVIESALCNMLGLYVISWWQDLRQLT